jgi:[ribosomal protein S18]-alanine N-acetyltransferase
MMRGAVAAERHKPAAACLVRPFDSNDASFVREIFQNSPQAGAFAPDSSEQPSGFAGPLALVSESQGEVTGFLLGREVADEAEIFNLAVAPHYRRQGHAAALVTSALEGMSSRGIQRVFLEVRESNFGAISFYEKLGFIKNGRRKGYYRHPDEAAITMEKKLTG